MAGEKDNKEDVKNEMNQNEVNHNQREEAHFNLNEFPEDQGRPLPDESIFQVVYMMWSIYFPSVLKLFEK